MLAYFFVESNTYSRLIYVKTVTYDLNYLCSRIVRQFDPESAANIFINQHELLSTIY